LLEGLEKAGGDLLLVHVESIEVARDLWQHRDVVLRLQLQQKR
jgi:hypothetical protein